MNKYLKLLILCNFLNFFGFTIFAPLHVLFGLTINPDVSVITTAWGIYVALTGVFIFAFGKIENDLSMRRMRLTAIAGYFILALGSLAFVVVDSVISLYLVLAVNAFGSALITPVWRVLFTKSEDKGKAALEWAYLEGGHKLILASGTVIGGLILKFFGFPAIFVIMFSFQLIAALLSIKLLRSK